MSKGKEKKFPPYVDLHALDHPQRRRVIIRYMMANPGKWAAVVVDDKKVAQKYINKIKVALPTVQHQAVGSLTGKDWTLKFMLPDAGKN